MMRNISCCRRSLWMVTVLMGLSLMIGCVEKRPQPASRQVEPPRNRLFSGEYRPDIETFIQIGSATAPAISNDGRRVFFVPSFTNAPQLFRLNEAGWPYQLTSFPDGIASYKLSHDGYYAIVCAAVGGNENTQLYLLDTESGRIRQLTNAPKVQHNSVIWSFDDKTIYFYSNAKNGRDFMIYRLDLPAGLPKLIQEKAGYNGPAGITRDGRRLLTYTYHSNRNADYYLLDLESGTEVCITPHEGDRFYADAYLTPSADTAYLVTNNTPDGVLRLAVVDLHSMKLTFLEPNQPWEVERGYLSEDGRYLAWIINEDGYGKPFVQDRTEDEPLSPPGLQGMFSLGGITRDGSVLFSFNNANHNPDLWLWDSHRRGLKRLTYSSTQGIDIGRFIEPKLIKYESFDSLEIPAFLYLPPGYAGGPVPFIMDMHGGPESQARPAFNRHFNYLLANGFGVFTPNVRGSTGYGRKYQDLDNYKNRLNSVADAAWGARWLIQNGYTTAAQLGVKGGSYGGYMTMALITEYPDLFAAAWDQVGIVNFETFLEKTAAYRQALRESEYGPLSDREFLRSISPIHKIDRVRCPVMVVHGLNDPRVPIEEARQVISALKKRGIAVDSLIFADEGHGVDKLENRLPAYRKMVEFFGKALRP